MKMLGLHLLICSLIIASTTSSSSSNNNNNVNAAYFSSPIRELGPSLAASVAGGTIIAARSIPRPSSSSLPTNNDDDVINSGREDVVVDGEKECLVVLFRSPIVSESQSGSAGTKQRNNIDVGNLTIASVFGYQTDEENDANSNTNQQNNYYHGLSFLPNGPVNLPFLPSSSGGSGNNSGDDNNDNNNNIRILHAPSGLLVAATGFAPDADHILNVAAGRVLSRISVYDSSMIGCGSKSVDPHRLVREDLSAMMVDAAMSEGGRPVGVQLLVIGQSVLSSRRRRIGGGGGGGGDGGSLEIYTVDPSGGWRSCVGRGAAVGRGAERVSSSLRSNRGLGVLEDASLRATDITYGWRGALDRAMIAAIHALEQDGESNDNMNVRRKHAMAKYGAVVIFGSSHGPKRRMCTSRCAAINPVIVEECYNVCCQKVMGQKLAE